jgi:CMP-N-acetylneuraminic acid synthetase
MNKLSANKSLSVVLPMRAGSGRVPGKNMRSFDTFEFGLAELKLRQLLQVKEFDEILIDTDEPRIFLLFDRLRNAPELAINSIDRIRVEERDPAMATSVTTTDSLIQYLAPKLRTEHVLWTHVTSPFVSAEVYRSAISSYFDLDRTVFDSLMSVSKLQEFIWSEQGPENYDYSQEKWPRTQTLPEWYFINSGLFICPSDFYRTYGNRIGERPSLFQMDKIIGFDVDWPEDFEMAEALASRRPEMVTID